MAVISALALSVFLPKRITYAESQKNCSKDDLKNIQKLYNLLPGDSWLQKQNKQRINGSSVQNSTEKACPLGQLPLQDGKHTAQKNVELSST